jgi:NDP-sugar pyrophosphorylase family protein
MKAMVLAAGQGTRLRPLTDNLPKALVRVAGRPMIEYPLMLLKHYGIHEIVINLHHFGEQIETHLGDGRRLGLQISYSKEQQLLDSGGGLRRAKPFFNEETFLVINTDVLIDLPLSEVLHFHKQKKSAATLVLRADEDADRYGSMDIDTEGRIYRFLQSRSPLSLTSATRKLMFTGVQVLEPTVFDYMPAADTQEKFSTTRETYPAMVSNGEALYGFSFDGFWHDLGTAERIEEAERSLAERRTKLHYLCDG